MSTLAVFACAPSPELAEGLRIVAAFVATGDTPRVVEIGDGIGALDPDRLDDESARVLETLAEFEVRPEPVDAAGLVEAVASASRVIRVAPNDRPGAPELLILDVEAIDRGRQDPAAFLDQLLDAGQVVVA